MEIDGIRQKGYPTLERRDGMVLKEDIKCFGPS